jgi:hypothetical protein
MNEWADRGGTPGDLEAFGEHYIHPCCHKSLNNVTRFDTRLGRTQPSSNNVRGSSDRPSNIGACNTAGPPPKITPERGPHCSNLRRESCQMF